VENQKPVVNGGLLDALESLGAALSVVSISVDMVREELQSVLAVLAAPTDSAPVTNDVDGGDDAGQSQLFPFPVEAREAEELKAPPVIYLVESDATPDCEIATKIYCEPEDECEAECEAEVPVRLAAVLS
jgi:hypothetical protein